MAEDVENEFIKLLAKKSKKSLRRYRNEICWEMLDGGPTNSLECWEKNKTKVFVDKKEEEVN